MSDTIGNGEAVGGGVSAGGGVATRDARDRPSRAAGRPRRALSALSSLGRRVERWRLLDGLAVLGLAVVAGIAASFLLDYTLALPRVVRGVFLVGGIVGLGVLAVRRGVLRRGRAANAEASSQAALALLVEETHPDLRQSLLTAVELTREGNEGAAHVSADLLTSVVEDVERSVGNVSFDRVVRLGRFARNVAILSVGAVVLIGAASSAPRLAGIWWTRNVLLGAERWPKGTILEIEAFPATVAVGDRLGIRVRLVRGDPRVVEVETESSSDFRRDVMERRDDASWDVAIEELPDAAAGGLAPLRELGVVDEAGDIEEDRLSSLLRDRADSIVRAVEAAGGRARLDSFDVFVHEFHNISRPLRFWIEGGDDRIGPFTVDVRTRPRIDMGSIAVRYRLPEYTGDSGEQHEQTHGNLKVPEGTRVSYSMATNIPVASAFFVLEEGFGRRGTRDDDAFPAAGAVKLDLESRQRFSGEFVVTKSGTYFFQFEDPEGFRSERPERFRIQAIDDRKPRVRITEPTKTVEQVTPLAKVAIHVRCEDDYGIRRAVLEGRFFPPGTDENIRQSRALLDPPEPGATPRRQETVELSLDIATIETHDGRPPEPGSRFEFYALAEDFGISEQSDADGRPIGQIGESQVHLFEIVDASTLESGLTTLLMVVRDELKQDLSRQRAARKNLESFRESALLKESIGPEEAAELSRHRQDQSKISDNLARQVGEVDRVLEKMAANQVGEGRMQRWVAGVRDEIRELAEEASPEIANKLGTLRDAARESPQDATDVNEIIADEREMERNLHAVVMRLETYGDKSHFLQLLRTVRDRQRELRDDTRLLIETESDPPPEPRKDSP